MQLRSAEAWSYASNFEVDMNACNISMENSKLAEQSLSATSRKDGQYQADVHHKCLTNEDNVIAAVCDRRVSSCQFMSAATWSARRWLE